MDKKVGFVCAFCGSLAFLSAIFAFAAEGTRLKAKDVKMTKSGEYIYPSSLAARFGSLSLLFFMISQIITNVAIGCFCCKSHQITQSKNRWLALTSFVFSWLLFVFPFFMLLVATTFSENPYALKDENHFIKPGYFAGAGILVLATIALGLIPYVIQSKSKNNDLQQQQNQGILMGQQQFSPQNYPPGYMGQPQFPPQNYPPGYMGQPQFPPQNYPPGYMGQPQFPPQNYPPQPNKGSTSNNSDPVFVHEDTYQRQQNP